MPTIFAKRLHRETKLRDYYIGTCVLFATKIDNLCRRLAAPMLMGEYRFEFYVELTFLASVEV